RRSFSARSFSASFSRLARSASFSRSLRWRSASFSRSLRIRSFSRSLARRSFSRSFWALSRSRSRLALAAALEAPLDALRRFDFGAFAAALVEAFAGALVGAFAWPLAALARGGLDCLAVAGCLSAGRCAFAFAPSGFVAVRLPPFPAAAGCAAVDFAAVEAAFFVAVAFGPCAAFVAAFEAALPFEVGVGLAFGVEAFGVEAFGAAAVFVLAFLVDVFA